MEEVTEYELKRQENVLRNAAMIAALGVQSAVQDLRLAHVTRKEKSYKSSAELKRLRTEPIVLRRSLRSKGVSPENNYKVGIDSDDESNSPSSEKGLDLHLPGVDAPLSRVQVSKHKPGTDTLFLQRIIKLQQLQDETPLAENLPPDSCSPLDTSGLKVNVPDPMHLRLEKNDMAKLVRDRIFNVLFLSLKERLVLVAGDKSGHIGLWDVDCDADEGDGVYIYRPHTAPVSAIASNTYDVTKLLSCSYDGRIRVMDMEKGVFSVIQSSGEELSALCYAPDSSSCAYLGDFNGDLQCVDMRDGKISHSLSLHKQRVNSIQFNPERSHLMLTSSTDAKVCLWDVRHLEHTSSKYLSEWKHPRAVQSAYFSPSGKHVASTCYDDYIRIWSGLLENSLIAPISDEPTKIFHNNRTNRWLSTFRAIWGWNDRHLFIGSMSRAIDVISVDEKRVAASMRSEVMTSIPCRFACHSLVPGLLAGGTAGGKVYLWR